MLIITPDIVEATYELLRVTPPFNKWRLPPGDAVEFRVTASCTMMGTCDVHAAAPCIELSERLHGHLSTVLQTVAHEMLHLWQDGRRARRLTVAHNAEFRRVAQRIARIHGFDPRTFI
jgi:hypothetical protein